jgi:hypothetical protein
MDDVSAPFVIRLLSLAPGIDCRDCGAKPLDHVCPFLGHRVVSGHEDPRSIWDSHEQLCEEIRILEPVQIQLREGDRLARAILQFGGESVV